MFQNRHKTGIKRKKYVLIAIYVGFVGLMFAGLTFHILQNNKHPTNLTTSQVDVKIVETVVSDLQNGPSSAPRDLEQPIPIRTDELLTQPTWQAEAAAWNTTPHPKLAIIIDDLGMTESATRQLASVRGPLTMAFLPYAANLIEQTQIARQAGHELMVHLPMQSSQTGIDHGENALLEGLSYEEFDKRLTWNLSQFSGYVGVNNHMGSRLTEDPGQMVRLMQRLNEKGYLFIDSLTTSKSVGASAARAANVPHAARDIFLDNVREVAYIKKQLAAAERIAKTRGFAVAIGHPYPETISVLKEWRKSNEDRGITLVPASQIVLEAMEWRIQNGR